MSRLRKYLLRRRRWIYAWPHPKNRQLPVEHLPGLFLFWCVVAIFSPLWMRQQLLVALRIVAQKFLNLCRLRVPTQQKRQHGNKRLLNAICPVIDLVDLLAQFGDFSPQ